MDVAYGLNSNITVKVFSLFPYVVRILTFFHEIPELCDAVKSGFSSLQIVDDSLCLLKQYGKKMEHSEFHLAIVITLSEKIANDIVGRRET